MAPSPTGALHLGNARTFLINWALARRSGWKVVLRIEDLDGPRIKSGADQQAIDVLRWLGIDWDEGPTYQRCDLSRYHAALDRLGESGLIYPCRCSRTQIAAASAQSAPHGDDHELRYPGTCRPSSPAPVKYDPADGCAWRLRVPEEAVEFEDGFAGPQRWNVHEGIGDFIVATRAGLPAYQLAVVVDDAAQGVTDVVRGDDLLGSTPRQMLLYRMLGLGEPPRYVHVPLVVGEDGRRLAKRHGDTRVEHYRQLGVAPERVVGLLGRWCGVQNGGRLSAAEFAERFTLEHLPRGRAVFMEGDDRWLCER